MVAPFKRSDWNGILQQINALITANGLSAAVLPTVPNGHRWSTADIQAARNKLNEISLVPLVFAAPLVKWSQAIVDELNAAIRNCVCVDPTVHVVDNAVSHYASGHSPILRFQHIGRLLAPPGLPGQHPRRRAIRDAGHKSHLLAIFIRDVGLPMGASRPPNRLVPIVGCPAGRVSHGPLPIARLKAAWINFPLGRA